MADVEYGDYKIRKGARLAYNDGTGPKVAREGDTVSLPVHQAEGEFAQRLEHPDGRPVERSRWSLADINRAAPAERMQMVQARLSRMDQERAELQRIGAEAQAESRQATDAKQQRRAKLGAGE